jgi:HK97 gp10 family phage protein
VTGKLKGTDQLVAFLTDLPQVMQQKMLRGAARAGAEVIADEARTLVPVENGDLRASIKSGAARRGDQIAGVVQTEGKGAFVAPWVEFGTAAHIISVAGRSSADGAAVARANRRSKSEGLKIGAAFVGPTVMHPGSRPKPFLRPALEAKRDEAIIAMGNHISERIAAGALKGADEQDDVA